MSSGRSGRVWRILAAAAIAVVGLTLCSGTASAGGAATGGIGSQYFLSNALGGTADQVFVYGDAGDVVQSGDWDGNGTDTPLIRRANSFFLRNSNSTGTADLVFAYGNPGDVVLVGDWDGDGVDTLAVRRGNSYYIKNSLTP